MKQPLPAFRALALAAGVILASTPMLAAAPLHVPQSTAASSDVVKVQSSTTIIRREKPHDGAWKRPDQRGEVRRGDVRREGRREAREERNRQGRNGQGRNDIYTPQATPKYAYDAQGRFTVYDGNVPRREHRWDGRRNDRRREWRWSNDWRGWDDGRWDDGRWDDKDRWDDGHRRPRYKMQSFGFQQPSPALKKVLTAVPKDADG